MVVASLKPRPLLRAGPRSLREQADANALVPQLARLAQETEVKTTRDGAPKSPSGEDGAGGSVPGPVPDDARAPKAPRTGDSPPASRFQRSEAQQQQATEEARERARQQAARNRYI